MKCDGVTHGSIISKKLQKRLRKQARNRDPLVRQQRKRKRKLLKEARLGLAITGSYKAQRHEAQEIATQLNQVKYYETAYATVPSGGTLVSVCCSPYLHMHICSAKKDWVGRDLISILVGNFSGFSQKYFLKAIDLRLISINESRASPDQVIKDGDILRHLVLRHEPRTFFWTRHTTTAVSTAKTRTRTCSKLLSSTSTNPSITQTTVSSTISIPRVTSSSLPNASIAPLRANYIPCPADTRVGSIAVKWFGHDRVLVADKPPGIPVHPCGAYYHHTVTQLLAAGRWYSTDRDSRGALEGHSAALRRRRARLLRDRVHALHRLDRLVGGVLLLCTDANTARDMAKDIGAGDCDKIYVARVSGKFPHRVTCSQPIRKRAVTVNAANGSSEPLRECHADGKPAQTTFELLRYLQDGTSLVRCQLRSGRTHQIRVHLAHLGHPIANDPLYNPARWTRHAEALVMHAGRSDLLARRERDWQRSCVPSLWRRWRVAASFDATSTPTTSDATSTPTTSDATSTPTTSNATSTPTTSDATSTPTTSNATSTPTTSNATSNPTTSNATSIASAHAVGVARLLPALENMMEFKVDGCRKDDGHHGDDNGTGDGDAACGAKDEDDGDGVQSTNVSDDSIGEGMSLSRLHTSCRLIWLHCAVYACPKWTFRTERLPPWSQEAENDLFRCKESFIHHK